LPVKRGYPAYFVEYPNRNIEGVTDMPYKICSFCGKASYSAAESSTVKWLCPYCNEDISHVEGLASLPPKDKTIEEK
jgi:hypothetical protein